MAEDPKLAPGRDPGGEAVAVLADGFDYLRPELAATLARDGEGEAIAWDAVDGDHRPFARDGTGAEAALACAAGGGVRVVAVRVPMGDAASLAKGVGFAASTPARMVVVALAGEERSLLDVMAAAAQRFKAMLFVVSVPAPTADETKAGAALANVVLINSQGSQLAAAETIATALGCERGALVGASGAELKRSFLARLSKPVPVACKPDGGPQGE
ncbi:MAG: hypothetical protein AB7J30_15635 [Hyphomicrobium sp.]